jgi:NADH/NAD ratio-sensing transcriptional regulator Rex
MINKSFENFDKKIDLLAKLGKPTIGFGLKVINEEILKNLRKSSSYARIILVGPKAIETEKRTV